MSGYNEKQKEYTIKYMKDKLDEIKFRVPKGKKAEIREHAEEHGLTLTKFIINAIDEAMERDNSTSGDADNSTAPTLAKEPPAAVTQALANIKPLTPEASQSIDLKRLASDFAYQVEIADTYGDNVLNELLVEARSSVSVPLAKKEPTFKEE